MAGHERDSCPSPRRASIFLARTPCYLTPSGSIPPPWDKLYAGRDVFYASPLSPRACLFLLVPRNEISPSNIRNANFLLQSDKCVGANILRQIIVYVILSYLLNLYCIYKHQSCLSLSAGYSEKKWEFYTLLTNVFFFTMLLTLHYQNFKMSGYNLNRWLLISINNNRKYLYIVRSEWQVANVNQVVLLSVITSIIKYERFIETYDSMIAVRVPKSVPISASR